MTNDTLDVLWNVCDAPSVNVSWCLADSDQEDLSHNSGLKNIRKPLGKYLYMTWILSLFLFFVCILDIQQCRSFLIEIHNSETLQASIIYDFHALVFRYYLIFLDIFYLINLANQTVHIFIFISYISFIVISIRHFCAMYISDDNN